MAVWKDYYFTQKRRDWTEDPFEDCYANRVRGDKGEVCTVVILSIFFTVVFCWVVEWKNFAVVSLHELEKGRLNELPP